MKIEKKRQRQNGKNGKKKAAKRQTANGKTAN
jgi:hypothetical protein